VGALVSNATAMWLGFSFSKTSKSVLVNPSMTPVFSPLELILGFLLKAK
jgi:hypothetical protein